MESLVQIVHEHIHTTSYTFKTVIEKYYLKKIKINIEKRRSRTNKN